ncbi:MAG: DMT family transporter [Candidatus Thermoplasmatota archaeon]
MTKKPYLAMIVSIIAVSFASIFILTCTAHPLSISFYRILFTTILVLPFVVFRKKNRKEIRTLPLPKILFMILIGIILALHFALWITSLTQTSVASSVILVTAHPMIVAPIAHYLLKERLAKINILGIVLSVSGVIILVSENYYTTTTLDSLEGNILAMLGGVAAGLYILGGRKTRNTVSIFSYAAIVYASATTTLFCICILLQAPIIGLSATDYGLIFLMALISGIFGHTLYNWSLKYIRASIASVMLLGEPIGSTLLAFAIPWIKQQPPQFSLIGGSLILVGIYLTARVQHLE